MKKILLAVIAAVLTVSSLSACTGTVEGAGRDIERMGRKIQGK